MTAAEQTILPKRVSAALQDVFGFTSFRENQRDVVEAILARRDVFVVMPTGGGKSLCYQLPAHLMDGTCLVISPLISLMKDQVDAAVANGLRAACLNSSLDPAARRDVTTRLRNGDLDLLYISPERYAVEGFSDLLSRLHLSFVAIDEAHCISEWGHDFRPDYLSLGSLTETLENVPVAAFTATATVKVQNDIVSRLSLRNPLMIRASFNRPNLYYAVKAKQNANDQILRFIEERPGEAGIVYRTSRKSVEQTAAYLVRHGIKARPYHAGLDDDVRAANQEAFNRDDVDVIVATIAFGMGIDKSNVRFVLHGDLPRNVEGYYQETGRSGRDGDPAHCLLLFSYGDIPRQRYFIDQVADEQERARALRALNDVVTYASTHACRRRQLLGYFGETFGSVPCGTCDVCTGEVKTTDATLEAQMVLSAIYRTGQRFGVTHVIDVVAGANTEKIRKFGHDQLKTYGVGKDRDKRYWRRLMDNLLAQGVVAMSDDEYPTLRLAPPARDVLNGDAQISIMEEARKPARKRAQSLGVDMPIDSPLFEHLRSLRKELAARRGVPSYVIFNDRTLHEMAAKKPASEMELLGINGVGQSKLEKFGEIFLKAIAEYEHGKA